MRNKLHEDLQTVGVSSSHYQRRFSSQGIDKCLPKTEKCSEVISFCHDVITVMRIFVTVIVTFCSPMRIFGGFTFKEGTWLDINTKKPSGIEPNYI